MVALSQTTYRTKSKLRSYWSLIKSYQTGLLLSTGLAGYMSARCPVTNILTIVGLTLSLFLAISGSTLLNMWWDRDIDSKMKRTHKRPLASGDVNPGEALVAGLVLTISGILLALAMNALYGLVVFAGFFFDMVIYTVWLKRRTCWSVVWGGISGGMPILAGRVLGIGSFEWIGITMALGILLWIPTHIMTFSMKYHDDYRDAGIPTFPSTYGFGFTRATVAVSSILAAIAMGFAAWGIGMKMGHLCILMTLSAGLLALAVISVLRPSERVNFGLFKYASVYMLSSMVLMMV